MMTEQNHLQIRQITLAERPVLEAFLRRSSESTIFHRAEWHDLIHATYAHECQYWAAWSQGTESVTDESAASKEQIVGVFPVVSVRHPLFGLKMVAMAYQMHSGFPLAEDESVRRHLISHVIDEAKQRKAKYLEIRHCASAHLLEDMGFVSIDSQLVTTSTPLVDFSGEKVRRGHRREVAYALDRGVEIVESQTIAELRLFRDMYMKEARDMASPQAGWIFFRSLYDNARDKMHLLLAMLEGRCIGGLLTLDDGNIVFARYGAYGSKEAHDLNLSKALLWRALRDSADRGCKSFNFGISWAQNKSLVRWKEGWGGTTRPVYVYVYPIQSDAPSPGGYFEGFQLAKAVWRKMPLSVVNWAGHQVTRWVC